MEIHFLRSYFLPISCVGFLSIRFLGALTQGKIDLLLPKRGFISVETEKKWCSGKQLFGLFLHIFVLFPSLYTLKSHKSVRPPNQVPQL